MEENKMNEESKTKSTEISKMPTLSKQVPSEHVLSAKWDHCIQQFLVHFTVGLTVGGLSSIVLLRTYIHSKFVNGYLII